VSVGIGIKKNTSFAFPKLAFSVLEGT